MSQTVTLRIVGENGQLLGAVRVAKAELASLGTAAAGAGQQAERGARGVDQVGAAAERTQRRASLLSGTLRQLKALLVGYVVLQGIRELGQSVDVYADIIGKLKQVSDGERELATAKAATFAIAQQTFQSLDATTTLYSRSSQALQQYGASQATVAELTRTINQGLLVSRATTAESASAILQLSQAMGAGALRGEEFNSVIEAAPRLMQALADSLRVRRGDLKKMAEDGELTVEKLLQAWTGPNARKIAEEAAKVPVTIGRAWQQMKNEVLRTIGELDQAGGASPAFAQAIQGLTASIGTLIKVAAGAGIAVAASFAGRGLQQIVQWTAAVNSAALAESALREIRISTARQDLVSAELRAADAVATLRAVEASRALAISELAAANAQVATAQRTIQATEATSFLSASRREATIATEQLRAAEARRNAALSQLATLGQQQVRVQRQAADAADGLAMATGRLNEAGLRGAGMLGRMRGAVVGLATSFVNLAGGPIGLVIAGIGILALKFADASAQARQLQRDATAALSAATDFLDNPSVQGFQATGVLLAEKANLQAQEARLRNLSNPLVNPLGFRKSQEELRQVTTLLGETERKIVQTRNAAVELSNAQAAGGRTMRQVASDNKDFNQTLADQNEKLVVDRIEREKGIRAALEYQAVKATGARDASQLSDATRALIETQVRERSAADAAKEATKGLSDAQKDAAKSAKELAQERERLAQLQYDYARENERMLANFQGPEAVAEVAFRQAREEAARMLAKGDITPDLFKGRDKALQMERDEALSAAKAERERADAILQAGKALEEERRLSQLSNAERAVEEELIKAVNQAREDALRLKDKAIELDEREQEALRGSIRARQELQRFVSTRDELRGMADDLAEEVEQMKAAAGAGGRLTAQQQVEIRLRRVLSGLSKERLRALEDEIGRIRELAAESDRLQAAENFQNTLTGVLDSTIETLRNGGDAWDTFRKQGVGALGALARSLKESGGFAKAMQGLFVDAQGNPTAFTTALGTIAGGGGTNAGSGAALGAQIGAYFGVWGAVIGAVLGGLVGSQFDDAPEVRVAGSAGSIKGSVEQTRQTPFGQVRVRTESMTNPTSNQVANALLDFDRAIAKFMSPEQIAAAADRLRTFSSKTGTLDEALENRLSAVLGVFDPVIADFVQGWSTDLTERIQALGDILQLKKLEGDGLLLTRTLERTLELVTEVGRVGETIAQTYQRLAGAAQQYGNLVGNIENDIARSGLTDYQKSVLDIEVNYRRTIKQVNDLAKAMGLAGARSEDLAKIEQWRAIQLAALQRQQEEEQRRAAEDLLLDRELSPLRDDQRLQEALRQFRAAASGGDFDRANELSRTVLDIGRGFYASGADYRMLFDEITGTLAGMSQSVDTTTLGDLADILLAQPDEIAKAMFDLLYAQEVAPVVAPPPPPPPPVTGTGGGGDTGGTDTGTNTVLQSDPVVVQSLAEINARLAQILTLYQSEMLNNQLNAV